MRRCFETIPDHVTGKIICILFHNFCQLLVPPAIFPPPSLFFPPSLPPTFLLSLWKYWFDMFFWELKVERDPSGQGHKLWGALGHVYLIREGKYKNCLRCFGQIWIFCALFTTNSSISQFGQKRQFFCFYYNFSISQRKDTFQLCLIS